MKAILLISHGSRSVNTKKEVVELIVKLKVAKVADFIEYAFLELEEPSIPDGIDLCVRNGAKDIKILLNFLNSGRHVDQDIPRIILDARTKYPDVNIKITKPVGQHPGIVNLFLDLLN